MEFESYSRDIELLKNKLNNKKTELALAKKSNEELKDIKVKYNNAVETLKDINFMVEAFNQFHLVTNQEDANFKRRRLDYLCNFIDANLEKIFPYDNLKAKIPVDFKYKSQVAKLKLVSGDKVSRSPKIASGGLKRHLISFSSSLALAECMGMNKMYLDEAFNSSSPENLTKIGEILYELVKKDFQVVLVEHKSDIYKDLPRREIHLKRDELTNKVSVTDVIDY
ncbi:P-loop NTPase family protein [Paraclostridium bifermentans]|uniref:hypothetical protein n=1 Tax=Paraclostridium bifermentans TaxID=1490 RepID=UPI00374E3514